MSEPARRRRRFVPAENRVDALTYEVRQSFLVEATNHVKDASQHPFSFRYQMTP